MHTEGSVQPNESGCKKTKQKTSESVEQIMLY